jgi:aryl-phospho-beta-D-glucosidase BglC (GH1 family)
VKGWVVLTARAAEAAGDGGDGHTVFTNDELRKQMIAMWAFLANRYKNKGGVAGYEVMSEPRTENDNGVVHKFHVDACNAMWKEDPAAVCFVGPARYYDRYHLGPEYLVSGGPVIYAANYLCPNNWIKGSYKGVAYGESGRCCDIGASKDCPSGCNEKITLNKKYLEQQLAPIDEFRSKHNVPMWIDQWGVAQDIGGGSKSQRQYLKDLLSLYEERQHHTSYWWYRDPSGSFSGCEGSYEIWCKLGNDKYHWNEIAIQEIGKYMSDSATPVSSVSV